MTEIERALRSISQRIKDTAFRMPPPNDYTPEFVMHANSLDQLRAIVAKEQRRVAELEGALKQCSLRFMEYADSHFSKGTPDGDMKGQRNVDMVEMIEKAIGRDGDG